MANNIKRYIITGAPGTGKSSVLNELMKKGYACFSEVSREIIKKQQELGGDLLPWRNLKDFAEECYNKMLTDCENAQKGINFFDRGIPDIIAYLKRRNLEISTFYFKKLDCYEVHVFFCPVWSEIFVNDPQRAESFNEALILEKHLLETYQSLGFKIYKMPFVNVNQRIIKIENIIKNEKI
ncbi:MAG: AAA family ATPase [Bacteroidales bacterium]|nr:AAA family ATPase [Bacteroidales bacterium]